ncbi:hypothetical protein FTO70_06870 [Methanosarcina sp. KYL-1]|uniref:hypothetical protein n=1 Tax=Methanosarcina sp. KYL-1 TaxID=2602068 RepID=UPI002101179E|nr:hypothetical protein [Methanosarcina sp. KYL-1]MCQ1535413.1 hypothetical protein [Methanosarcina sp. KYL-1]
MGKINKGEPEFREDLQGRIEVFDQSIRSFEKRLRAVERRLSLEEPPAPGAGSDFPGRLAGSFQNGIPGEFAGETAVSPQGPSVFPADSFPLSGSSFLSSSVSSLSEGDASNLAFSTMVSSAGASGSSVVFLNSSSEVSAGTEKIKELNALFSSFSESLNSLQEAVSELSDFVHDSLQPEIERLGEEVEGVKKEETAVKESAARLKTRIEAAENQNRFTLGSIKVPVEVSGVAGASVLFLTGVLVWSGRWDVIRSPYFSMGLAFLMAAAVFLKFYMVNRKQKSMAVQE